MIIKWTEQRMKVIPSGAKKVVLFPGYNQVSDETFEAIKPHIAMDITLGRLVLEAKQEGDKLKPVPAKKLTPAELKRMAKETNNIESLRGWLDDEERPEARRVLEKRIDEIEAELKKGGQPSEPDEE